LKNKIVFILIIVLFLLPSIPQIDAAKNQIIEYTESKLKIKDNLNKNAIISNKQKSTPFSKLPTLSLVVSAGEGRGYFFPPRPVIKRFFCQAAIIFYTNIFSLTLINNHYHRGVHILIFIGIARVWINDYFLIKDDIALMGTGIAIAIF